MLLVRVRVCVCVAGLLLLNRAVGCGSCRPVGCRRSQAGHPGSRTEQVCDLRSNPLGQVQETEFSRKQGGQGAW